MDICLVFWDISVCFTLKTWEYEPNTKIYWIEIKQSKRLQLFTKTGVNCFNNKLGFFLEV